MAAQLLGQPGVLLTCATKLCGIAAFGSVPKLAVCDHLPWDVGARHDWLVQTLGTPNLLVT
jgi:hypothetical protein